MRARFQIIEDNSVILDTEMQVRNRFSALHELLRQSQVKYDPGQFKEKAGWVIFKSGHITYRTSTRFG